MPRPTPPTAQRWAKPLGATAPGVARLPRRLANRRGPAWWRQAARRAPLRRPRRRTRCSPPRSDSRPGSARARCPGGGHGDLFCDNVLFADSRVSGIIDFGFAATDFLAYDLAIAVNDWCIARDGDARAALDPRSCRRCSAATLSAR
ncbi:MAG: phosphotransferase [Betaproteobacteria bacterium]|nr:phosphotransferase [Betaproteobacteria bacterium]